MNKITKVVWIIGVVLIATFSFFCLQPNIKNPTYESIDLNSFAQELYSEANEIFNNITPIQFNTREDSIAQDLKKDKWYLLSYSNRKLTYWNSNKLSFDSSIFSQQKFPIRYTFGDDIYLVFKQRNSFLAYRIVNGGEICPRLINYNIAFKNKIINTSLVKETTSDLFILAKQKNTHKNQIFIFTIILILLFLGLFFYHLKQKQFGMYATTLCVLFINFLLFIALHLPFKDYFFISINSYDVLTNDQLLFIIFIHLITVTLVTLSIINVINNIHKPLTKPIIISILLFNLDFIITLCVNVVTHAHISLDFNRLIDLNIASYILLLFICISFILYWIVCYSSQFKLNSKSIKPLIYFVIGAGIFVLFQYLDANRDLLELARIPLFLLAFIIANTYIKSFKRLVYVNFSITAILITGILYYAQNNRDSIYLQQYASKLISHKDEETIDRLVNIENQLALEFLTPENNDNFNQRKDEIEGRIKQLYFSNYLEKYELKIISFGADGRNINQNKQYTQHYLDSIYNHSTQRTNSAYFYELDIPTNRNGYIAKYENCTVEGHFGSTYILLQPRIIQSDFLYPEAFKNQRNPIAYDLNQYSYGIYAEGYLISQLGEFPYKLNALPKESPIHLLLGGTKHTYISINEYEIILTTPVHPFRDILTIFTFVLIVIILSGILCSFVFLIFSESKNSITYLFLPNLSKYLSSRIQVSITTILIFGLLLSVYTIVHFESLNYNNALEDQLLNKVKNISSRLQNRVNLAEKLSNEEERMLILNEESTTYQVDINLFNNNGLLLGSSKPYITDNEILGTQMNPKAFIKLKIDENSQLLLQEELEGSDYLSAYVPLFGDNSSVIGYVNTPLFSKNELLNKQLSDLIINIINVYFLLLIVGGLIAYFVSKEISKPIEYIRSKIAKTALKGSNELIKYHRDDEIGQLVKQYNTMAIELQESVEQIANAEREVAWKEMAKQVAHEIKNPLTPMKLGIQHLKRSIGHKSPEELEELIQKTSNILLKQIDSLSIMAEQFSTFAQMPQDQFVLFDLSALTSEVIELHQQDESIKITSSIQQNIQVWSDSEQIRRVLINLITNAVQAIPKDKDGIIEITLSEDYETICLDVSDNGTGIHPENYSKIFTPKFSTKNSGMGLGLALSKKIIENSKGDIQFTSIVDKGTRFRVTLPKPDHENI